MGNISISNNTDAPLKFKGGAVIFAEGQTSKYLYLVKKGEVFLLKKRAHNLSAIDICGEREILNEVAILSNESNECSAIAKTDVEVVLIEKKDIAEVLKNSPSWIPEIFETLCERLKLTQEMIEEHNLAGEKDSRLVISKEDEKKYLKALADFKSDQA